MHCVDLGESFRTHIYLQNLASIQPRTSPLKSDEMRIYGHRPCAGIARSASPVEVDSGTLEEQAARMPTVVRELSGLFDDVDVVGGLGCFLC